MDHNPKKNLRNVFYQVSFAAFSTDLVLFSIFCPNYVYSSIHAYNQIVTGRVQSIQQTQYTKIHSWRIKSHVGRDLLLWAALLYFSIFLGDVHSRSRDSGTYLLYPNPHLCIQTSLHFFVHANVPRPCTPKAMPYFYSQYTARHSSLVPCCTPLAIAAICKFPTDSDVRSATPAPSVYPGLIRMSPQYKERSALDMKHEPKEIKG